MLDCVVFKQKTAYEMRISDWSSDVCSSDLGKWGSAIRRQRARCARAVSAEQRPNGLVPAPAWTLPASRGKRKRSEEHTSELQSLMRISYAVFCLKKKKNLNNPTKASTSDN